MLFKIMRGSLENNLKNAKQERSKSAGGEAMPRVGTGKQKISRARAVIQIK